MSQYMVDPMYDDVSQYMVSLMYDDMSQYMAPTWLVSCMLTCHRTWSHMVGVMYDDVS